MPAFRFCRLLGYLLPLLFLGCSAGQYPPEPDLVPLIPERWTTAQQAQFSEAMPERQWWRQFGDRGLETLIEELFLSNYALKGARERIVEAFARQGVVDADRQLQLAAALGYTHAETGDDTVTLQAIPPGRTVDIFASSLHASWELDLWGRTARLLEAAEADVRVAYSDYHGMQVSLAAAMALNHFDLQAFRAKRELVNQRIELEKASLRLIKNLYHAGSESTVKVAVASQQLNSAIARLPAIDQRIAVAVRRTEVLRGQPPGTLAQLSPATADSTRVPPLLGLGLPADLIARRPDIRQALQLYRGNVARLGAAEAERYPTLSISGNLSLSSDSLGKMLDPASIFYSLGPSFNVPLLTGGRTEAAVAVRRSQVEQARLVLEERLVTALSEVETAASGVIHTQQAIDRLAAAEQDGRRSLILSQELYQAGLADRFRVVDSSMRLLDIQEALVDARQAALIEIIHLYRALGGGWQTSPADRNGLAAAGQHQ